MIGLLGWLMMMMRLAGRLPASCASLCLPACRQHAARGPSKKIRFFSFVARNSRAPAPPSLARERGARPIISFKRGMREANTLHHYHHYSAHCSSPPQISPCLCCWDKRLAKESIHTQTQLETPLHFFSAPWAAESKQPTPTPSGSLSTERGKQTDWHNVPPPQYVNYLLLLLLWPEKEAAAEESLRRPRSVATVRARSRPRTAVASVIVLFGSPLLV